MNEELETRLSVISGSCDWCRAMGEGCSHCEDKEFLINVACAWAFDLGRDGA